MRRLVVICACAAALAAPASALALHASAGDGTLVVRNGDGTRGVPVEPTTGAHLGLHGRPITRLVNGDSSWERFTSSFSIRKSPSEVEMVCELVAEEGEAWFDLESLILRRVDPANANP